MWWSVPPEVTTFNTWREKTTVYHEGVPGHHLQVGQAVFERATLNTWRRLACWTSGHGEGWALYAERLMADLGFLDDPGDRLGMLDGQRMRAARVVFDLGVHLGLEAPEQWGGGTWDADKGWEFLKANINMPEAFIRFEWNRYLGWPGQAPSYKIGQRLWEQTRDEAKAKAEAAGEEFDIRAFHARALSLGSLPLDVLKSAFAQLTTHDEGPVAHRHRPLVVDRGQRKDEPYLRTIAAASSTMSATVTNQSLPCATNRRADGPHRPGKLITWSRTFRRVRPAHTSVVVTVMSRHHGHSALMTKYASKNSHHANRKPTV